MEKLRAKHSTNGVNIGNNKNNSNNNNNNNSSNENSNNNSNNNDSSKIKREGDIKSKYSQISIDLILRSMTANSDEDAQQLREILQRFHLAAKRDGVNGDAIIDYTSSDSNNNDNKEYVARTITEYAHRSGLMKNKRGSPQTRALGNNLCVVLVPVESLTQNNDNCYNNDNNKNNNHNNNSNNNSNSNSNNKNIKNNNEDVDMDGGNGGQNTSIEVDNGDERMVSRVVKRKSRINRINRGGKRDLEKINNSVKENMIGPQREQSEQSKQSKDNSDEDGLDEPKLKRRKRNRDENVSNYQINNEININLNEMNSETLRTFDCNAPNCHSSFLNESSYVSHHLTHHFFGCFGCCLCGLSFKNKISLIDHLIDNHNIYEKNDISNAINSQLIWNYYSNIAKYNKQNDSVEYKQITFRLSPNDSNIYCNPDVVSLCQSEYEIMQQELNENANANETKQEAPVLPKPNLPQLPNLPNLPNISNISNVSNVSTTSNILNLPNLPQLPRLPQITNIGESGHVGRLPKLPQLPQSSQLPPLPTVLPILDIVPELATLAKFPTLPSLPSLPRLPTLPTLPTLPRLPTVSNNINVPNSSNGSNTNNVALGIDNSNSNGSNNSNNSNNSSNTGNDGVNEIGVSCHTCGAKKRSDGKALLYCGRCQQARYCCHECQKTDWPIHQIICCDTNTCTDNGGNTNNDSNIETTVKRVRRKRTKEKSRSTNKP